MGDRPESGRRPRVALVYDCLYPYTVGGVERWYRCLATHLHSDHDVVYLTRRQWPRGRVPDTSFDARAVSPGLPLYTRSGRRSIFEALVWAAGLFVHLLRHGRNYDIVHTATAPYLSLVAAWLALRLTRSKAKLVVDWFEVWGRDYWVEYLGSVGGRIGHSVEVRCTRMADLNFTFSDLHAGRLEQHRRHGPVVRLTGLYESQPETSPRPAAVDNLAVFAGRHIPEKRVMALPAAIARAREIVPDARCMILGDGPESERLAEEVRRFGLEEAIDLRGKVTADEVAAAIDQADCLVLPSEREGYGLVVVEAVSRGTPAVVVEARDNAAPELVEDGVNGLVVGSTDPDILGAALARAFQTSEQLSNSTRAWYERNSQRLSIDGSVQAVKLNYRRLLEAQARR